MLALRYGCPLFTAICYRTAPGRWRIEFGDEIPTHAHGEPRPTEEIAREINTAFETDDHQQIEREKFGDGFGDIEIGSGEGGEETQNEEEDHG